MIDPTGATTPLSGQVAMVTGASAGIGLAIARRLAREGAAVVVNGRDGRRLADALRVIDGTTRAVPGDAAEPAVIRAMLDAAGELGDPAVAVANVGGGTGPTRLGGLDAGDMLASFRRNVVPAFELVNACGPAFAARGYGRIVVVSSLAGRQSSVLSGLDYSTSKAALSGLVRHAASELAASGVTVNCVAPGVTLTERIAARLDDRERDRVARQIPIRRTVLPEEVAAAVAYLVSPDSGATTGATLDVNGGSYMP